MLPNKKIYHGGKKRNDKEKKEKPICRFFPATTPALEGVGGAVGPECSLSFIF
jgi:hypothetical protein